MTPLTDQDIHLFNEGTHFRLYDRLGSHLVSNGTRFAVWAPTAESVSVVGDFNGWNPERHPLTAVKSSGVWEGIVGEAAKGAKYKYHVRSRERGYRVDKADPFAWRHEVAPGTASVIWDLEYAWKDRAWMESRRNSLSAPMSIYELHLGSWRRKPEEMNRPLGYREIAPKLVDHVKRTGFTHVELLPVMEHPFYGSWGYQITGFFAPTSRYGTPQDFMYLVDLLHQNGIGVILDWVPSHFPSDAHGLGYFDGTHLYEHADPRQGFHPDWKSFIFNYDRHEVRSFLISSALFWLDRFHADGLRVDGVASMLYLDYSRPAGEWIANEYGGRENLGAIGLLRRFNEEAYRSFPQITTIAEESTAWPTVSRPTYVGGLGFGYKWDMGWMHDTLEYMKLDPVHRKFHHDRLTFRMLYSSTENFVLPLSHDETVHGKGSLLGRMPGDAWQKFANLRLLYGYMYGQTGKKLLFMGGEFGQGREWNHDTSLDWHLLDVPWHQGVLRWVSDLNRVYRETPALHEKDCESSGFEWVECHDADQSALTFLRFGRRGPPVLVACNFTPVPRYGYRVGVPAGGTWSEILNSDAREYGGSGLGNAGRVDAAREPSHHRPFSLNLTLPPLSAIFLRGG